MHMEKFFISVVSLCGFILAILCVYRYFSYEHSSYVELVCGVAFLLSSIIAARVRKDC